MNSPGFLPVEVREAWDRCLAPTAPMATDRSGIGDQPEPVRRWVDHTLDGDAPLPGALQIEMHGGIRIGRWRPFRATQVLSPTGFVWAATAGHPPVRIRGFDRYTDQTGQMRWKMFGVIPVMTATGPDITRSAAGRLAGELMLLPGWALSENVSWKGIDDRTAVSEVVIGDSTHRVTVEIDERGALRSVSLPRWGNPDGGPFANHTFGVELGGERSFGGHRIPTRLCAGWFHGTDRWSEGEFFRATIDTVTLIGAGA